MLEFCLIVGGESVGVRGVMEAAFRNKIHVVLVGDGSFLLHVNAGKSCKILEKSGKNQGISFRKSGGNPEFYSTYHSVNY